MTRHPAIRRTTARAELCSLVRLQSRGKGESLFIQSKQFIIRMKREYIEEKTIYREKYIEAKTKLYGAVDNCVAINACSGAGGTSAWKTDVSLIHKLRLRCSYLGDVGGGTSMRPADSLPSSDVPPLNDGEHPALSELRPAGDGALPASSSSPSLPTAAESSARTKPPDVCDGREVYRTDRKRLDWASELDFCLVSGHDLTPSMSLGKLVAEGGGGLDAASSCGEARQQTGGLLRHASDLLASSGVRPELLVDFLRRRDVVGDEAVTAVRRSVARRAACELIAAVTASRCEIEALCDALRETDCDDVADCLAAVDSLLKLEHSDSVSSDSLSTDLVNDRLFQ